MYALLAMSFGVTGIVTVLAAKLLSLGAVVVAVVCEAWVVWRVNGLRFEAGPEGVVVQNLFHTHRFAWAAIARLQDGAISIGEGGSSWAVAVVPVDSSPRRVSSRATTQGGKRGSAEILEAVREIAAVYETTCRCRGPRIQNRARTPTPQTNADFVRHAIFKEAAVGYARDDVNEALDKLAEAIDAKESISELLPTPGSFRRVFRGYKTSEVDALIEQLRTTATSSEAEPETPTT